MHRSQLKYLPLALVLTACDDVDGHDHDGHNHNEHEVITTVRLTFTPDGGSATTFTWADPEDDGSPVIDDITLSADTQYTLAIAFLNELEDPAEDITEEVEDEGVEHQVFLTGTGVEGPASAASPALITVAYADQDDNGLPLGLEHTVSVGAAGTGDLQLVLAHLPEEDGAAVKVDGLAGDVKSDGLGAIPGEADVDVTLPLTVQ